VKDENEVDLFGDEPEQAPVEKPKPKAAAKPKKEKPVAKSILVFDVKVYDAETDLDELAKKVLAL
jgi:elongation factor 1-beta